jgi:hypothetical protein
MSGYGPEVGYSNLKRAKCQIPEPRVIRVFGEFYNNQNNCAVLIADRTGESYGGNHCRKMRRLRGVASSPQLFLQYLSIGTAAFFPAPIA